MQPYTTQFTLSREYLAECFDESKPYSKNAKPNFLFPIVMLAIGTFALAWTDQPKSLGFFIFILGVIELLHIRFKRAWWLARQMWGKSGGSEVTLNLDDQGIETQAAGTTTKLLWKDVNNVIETELGLILVTVNGGQQYLSKSLFSDDLIAQIIEIGAAK